MSERAIFITLFSILAAASGWLMYDKFIASKQKFSDKQTAMNYLYLIGKGDFNIMQSMDADYLIARANAIHDGIMTFTIGSNTYNTATGFHV